MRVSVSLEIEADSVPAGVLAVLHALKEESPGTPVLEITGNKAYEPEPVTTININNTGNTGSGQFAEGSRRANPARLS